MTEESDQRAHGPALLTTREAGRLGERLLRAYLAHLGCPDERVQLQLLPSAAPPEAYAELGQVHLGGACLSEGFWRTGGLGRRMLAHEAAHIAQFALKGPASSSLAALETEADRAAGAIVGGLPFRCRHRSDPRRLHWNRAGHYYTVYYVSLVAGAPEQAAFHMAARAQTPDLVSELDAPTQTARRMVLHDEWGAYAAGQALKRGYLSSDPGVAPSDYEICTDVIEGLHCLTGAPIKAERDRRIAALQAAPYDTLEFGIGLHALGDAWAHCTGGVMYSPRTGHLSDGHSPDSIHKHVQAYMEYVDTLWSIVRGKIAGAPRTEPKVAYDGLKALAERWADDAEEANQIAALRGLIWELSAQKALVNYAPPNTCESWAAFVPKTGGLFKPEDLDKILALGRKWRVSRPHN